MNPFKLVISEQTVSDLTEIWTYIAGDNPSRADNFTDRLYKKCQLLTGVPEMGRKRDELSPGLRSFPMERYVIFTVFGITRLKLSVS